DRFGRFAPRSPRSPTTQRELPFTPPAGGVAGVIDALEQLRERLVLLADVEAAAPPTLRLVDAEGPPAPSPPPPPPPPPAAAEDSAAHLIRGRHSTTVYLSPELRARVKHYSVDHDVTLSDLTERALRELLEREAGR
ncbi:MAG TPA: hypothetical protein VD838_09825, partial [Anaeromyxobacteraceae bacterium]|nr:hypothetical protein [Anaeromyxobacteraceae bacterium]